MRTQRGFVLRSARSPAEHRLVNVFQRGDFFKTCRRRPGFDASSTPGRIHETNGHVEFLQTFNPPNLVFQSGGETLYDNLFAVDDGMDGADAIISFTREMKSDGPVLQFD